MTGRVIVIAGAPSPASLLTWDAEGAGAGAVDQIEPLIAYFLGLKVARGPTAASAASAAPVPSSFRIPAWRSIPLEREGHFLALADVVAGPSSGGGGADDRDGRKAASQQLLMQFCEHSLGLDDDDDDGGGDDGSARNTPTASETDSTAEHDMTSISLYASPSEVTDTDTPKPAIGDLTASRLTTLAGIPAVQPVQQQQQQQQQGRQRGPPPPPLPTTISLIAGVISVERARAVRTRRGETAFLVEVLLGDETRSGFGVSFWHDSLPAAEAMRRRLRRRDVVLLQDVGLGVFMRSVYGRSVRRRQQHRGGGGGGTRVHVLYREVGEGGYYGWRDLVRGAGSAAAANSQLERTRVVAEWVRRFVSIGGEGGRGGGRGAGEEASVERPPLDSPSVI